MRRIRTNRSQERNDEVTGGLKEGSCDKKVGPVWGSQKGKHIAVGRGWNEEGDK